MMKTAMRPLLSLLIAPAMLFATGAVVAQEGVEQGDRFVASKPGGSFHADEIMGTDVVSRAEDDSIGAVRDLIIDDQGQITGVVVGVGGFLGIGEKSVAIAWDEVELERDPDGDGYRIHVALDEATLEEATEYQRDDDSVLD